MTRPLEPALDSGAAVWSAACGRVQVRFIGRAKVQSREEALALAAAAALSGPKAVAWARQIHSATVLPALPGACGEGDALIAERPGLALTISTADCVPVLLAAGGRIAALHAGWRGIVLGIVAATIGELVADGGEVHAWIGPAIGPCCYEVGEDVAGQVARASSAAVVHRRPGEKPHLDLQGAVQAQLEANGVSAVRVAPACTRCAVDWLWSYRRDGRAAGRNLAFVWLTSET